MTNKDWSIENLIGTAQAFDNSAQKYRRDKYASRRKLAFSARAWARSRKKRNNN